MTFKPGTDTPTQQAGRALMARIREHDERLRLEFVEAITETLGRPATGAETVLIESLASAHVRARRLRNRGRNDLEALRLIAELSAALAKGREPATA